MHCRCSAVTRRRKHARHSFQLNGCDQAAHKLAPAPVHEARRQVRATILSALVHSASQRARDHLVLAAARTPVSLSAHMISSSSSGSRRPYAHDVHDGSPAGERIPVHARTAGTARWSQIGPLAPASSTAASVRPKHEEQLAGETHSCCCCPLIPATPCTCTCDCARSVTRARWQAKLSSDACMTLHMQQSSARGNSSGSVQRAAAHHVWPPHGLTHAVQGLRCSACQHEVVRLLNRADRVCAAQEGCPCAILLF